jgi:predicted amidohydrolase YtcJ
MKIIRRTNWPIPRAIVWTFVWTMASVAQAQDATPVDTIYFNGRIVTVNQNSEVAQAFAVHKDRIVAVGDDSSLRKLATSNTVLKDLQGRVVLPGLIDSHVHAPDAALYEWDHPIPEMETIEGMSIAVERIPRGMEQALHPEQAITRHEAIRLYTWNNAYLTFEEKQKGSIEICLIAQSIRSHRQRS